MRNMFLAFLDLVPIWAQKWTGEDSANGRYHHHTAERPLVRRKNGRHRSGSVNHVTVDYGHMCTGDGCRCGYGNTFVEGVIEETGLFRQVGLSQTYGTGQDAYVSEVRRDSWIWEGLMGIVRWGEPQSQMLNMRRDDPWRETRILLRTLGVEGW